MGCGQCGLRQLADSTRRDLPAAARYPGRLGHGGERAGDGVRQHGRRLCHGRRLYARSVDR